MEMSGAGGWGRRFQTPRGTTPEGPTAERDTRPPEGMDSIPALPRPRVSFWETSLPAMAHGESGYNSVLTAELTHGKAR